MKRKHRCWLCDSEVHQVVAGIDLVLVAIAAIAVYLPTIPPQ